MSIQDDIKVAMEGVANGNVFVQLVPADVDPPYVAYRRVAQDPLVGLNSNACLAKKSTFAFECYGATYDDALVLAEQVKAALYASTISWHEESSPGEDYGALYDGFMEPVFVGIWVNN